MTRDPLDALMEARDTMPHPCPECGEMMDTEECPDCGTYWTDVRAIMAAVSKYGATRATHAPTEVQDRAYGAVLALVLDALKKGPR